MVQIRRWVESKLIDDQLAKLNGPSRMAAVVDSGVDKIEDLSTLDEEDRTCPICRERYGESEYTSEDAVRSKVCKHSFGSECLRIWGADNETCPMCRTAQFHPPPVAIPPDMPAWLFSFANKDVAPKNPVEHPEFWLLERGRMATPETDAELEVGRGRIRQLRDLAGKADELMQIVPESPWGLWPSRKFYKDYLTELKEAQWYCTMAWEHHTKFLPISSSTVERLQLTIHECRQTYFDLIQKYRRLPGVDHAQLHAILEILDPEDDEEMLAEELTEARLEESRREQLERQEMLA